MSRAESWRPVESAMDDDDAIKISKNSKKKSRLSGAEEESKGDEEDDEAEEKYDEEVWETLSRGFRKAQSVLDQNRALIQRVNENHRSKVPDNIANNVSLIREINGNISKVLSIYSDLSVNFSSIVGKRRGVVMEAMNAEEEDDEDEDEDKDSKAEN